MEDNIFQLAATSSPPWDTLSPLVLEVIGRLLAADHTPNALRARLACKHWHACITPAISSVTLSGDQLLLPANLLPHHPPAPGLETAPPAPSLPAPPGPSRPLPPPTRPLLIGGTLSPTLTHVTLSGHVFDPRWLASIPRHLPALTSLSLAAASYRCHSPTAAFLKHMNDNESTHLSQTLVPPPPPLPLPPEHEQGAAPNSVSGAPVAMVGSMAAAPAADLQSHTAPGRQAQQQPLAEGAPGGDEGGLRCWPLLPPHLRRLVVMVTDDMPGDLLAQLLLAPNNTGAAGAGAGAAGHAVVSSRNGGIPDAGGTTERVSEDIVMAEAAGGGAEARHEPSLVAGREEGAVNRGGVSTAAAAAAAPGPSSKSCPPFRCQAVPLSLRELCLALQGGVAAASEGGRGPPRPTLDLSPLLHPGLAGLTRLELYGGIGQAVVRHVGGGPAGGGGGAVVAAEQHQALGGPGLGADGGDKIGLLGRLTQLKSLMVTEQVLLASFGPQVLARLTALEELRLPGGVYCESAGELGHLAALQHLTHLDLNFGSEWWIDAADLRILSRLPQLRDLQLSLSYGLDDHDDLVCSYPGDTGSEDDDRDDDNKLPGGNTASASGTESGGAIRAPAAAAAAAAGGQISTSTERGDVGPSARRDTYTAPPCTEGNMYGTSPYGQWSLRGLADELQRAWRVGGRRRLGPQAGDPGGGDDWRQALGALTQVRHLGLRLSEGGGRHLAEALHGAVGLVAGGDSGGGASLTLTDAPAAAMLDVSYWAAVAEAQARAEAAAVVEATSVSSGAEAGPSGARLAPLPAPAPVLYMSRTIPLVSLTLGSGRGLTLSYGHVLCLALMTQLRQLELSFEVVTPYTVGGGDNGDNGPSNPLITLSRLRNLRTLHLRIKQPKRNEYMSADHESASPPPPVVPIDDAVLASWMSGMPLLEAMLLRGAGALREHSLVAMGRHQHLKTLGLRLRVPPVSYDDGSQCTTGSGHAAASMVGMAAPTAADVRDGGGTVQVGYGSYYAQSESSVAASLGGVYGTASADGAELCSGLLTPLGLSPPGPKQCTAAAATGSCLAAAAGAAPLATLSLHDVSGVGGPPAPANASPLAAARDGLLAAGAAIQPELLANVPYLIRPHHLPASLTSLDLTNAAFSAEWAMAPPALPRLVTLKLARAPPKRPPLGACRPHGAWCPGSPAPSPPPLDPTRITDWTLMHVVAAAQPCLAHLVLGDEEAREEAGPAAKLHHRALSQLRRLSSLETLTLVVGNRLRWRAQEALFAALPGSLRRLCLNASHLYREALEGATRLTCLREMQVQGYTDPAYVPELRAAAEALRSALPACRVLLLGFQHRAPHHQEHQQHDGQQAGPQP